MKSITVDAMGKQCPIPVIMTKKQLDALTEDARITVLVDNRTAVENLTRLAESTGEKPEITEISENEFQISFTGKPSGKVSGEASVKADDIKCDVPGEGSIRSRTVCVFSSRYMGTGDDELGKILIKGFIYALSQLDTPPYACLFYNGGAFLTTDDSESLEDIKAMEEMGTQIITCGTCADFYGIKDRIAVGEISNMYSIVEKMSEADKIIKP